MPHLNTDDGVRLYYEETGAGTRSCSSTSSPTITAATNRRSATSRGGTGALPIMRAAIRPPMCRRTGPIFAGSRPRRHPRGARRARDHKAQSSAFRWAALRPCISASPIPSAPLAGRRRLRLRRRARQGAQFQAETAKTAALIEKRRHGRTAKTYGSARRACSSRTRIRAAGPNSCRSSPSIRRWARRTPCAACRAPPSL